MLPSFLFNYEYSLITDEECDFFPWPRPVWLQCWVSVSWVSEEGDVVTTSEGQWKQIPLSKEAPVSLLPKETRFCHVHITPIFPRNSWTWRSIPTELVGGKVQIPEISSNCFLKRSGCRKDIWCWLQWGKVAVRVPFQLSNGELTLWRNFKTTPLGEKMQLEIYLPRQTSVTC